MEKDRRIGIRLLSIRLNVSTRTVARWIESRAFPAPHYLGSNRAWWVSQVEAWEGAQAAQPVAERPNRVPAAPREVSAVPPARPAPVGRKVTLVVTPLVAREVPDPAERARVVADLIREGEESGRVVFTKIRGRWVVSRGPNWTPRAYEVLP